MLNHLYCGEPCVSQVVWEEIREALEGGKAESQNIIRKQGSPHIVGDLVFMVNYGLPTAFPAAKPVEKAICRLKPPV